MNRRIAFFDFDGTITSRDTLFEFIKFSRGAVRFFLGFLLHSPVLIAYKLKLIPNQTAKEIVLTHFFRNMELDAFDRQCNLFARQLPGLVRTKAMKEIEELKNKGFEIVIVSASPENWLRPWTEALQLKLIATRLETKENRITGSILGANCHGQEKVNRIEKEYRLSEFDRIYAYGDTKGDLPMLKLATISFFRPFR